METKKKWNLEEMDEKKKAKEEQEKLWIQVRDRLRGEKERARKEEEPGARPDRDSRSSRGGDGGKASGEGTDGPKGVGSCDDAVVAETVGLVHASRGITSSTAPTSMIMRPAPTIPSRSAYGCFRGMVRAGARSSCPSSSSSSAGSWRVAFGAAGDAASGLMRHPGASSSSSDIESGSMARVRGRRGAIWAPSLRQQTRRRTAKERQQRECNLVARAAPHTATLLRQ